jgi:hypothetical protein
MNRDGHECGFKSDISSDDLLQQGPDHAQNDDRSTVRRRISLLYTVMMMIILEEECYLLHQRYCLDGSKHLGNGHRVTNFPHRIGKSVIPNAPPPRFRRFCRGNY